MRKLKFWVVMLGLLTLGGPVALGQDSEVGAGGKSEPEVASPDPEEIQQFVADLVERAMDSDREKFFAELQREYGDEHPLIPVTMGQVGSRLWEQGSHDEASVVLKRAVEAARQIWGEEAIGTLKLMHDLALVLRAQGDLSGALQLNKQDLAICRRTLGDDHPDTLASMNNLALTLSAQGDLSGARVLQDQVVSGRRRLLGDDHPDTLNSMNNLAETLKAQGDLSGARDLHDEGVSVRRRLLGDDHPDTLASMNNLALTLSAQGDLSGARDLLDQVVSIRRRLLGDDHPDTLNSMNNLASTFSAQGDLYEARELGEQVLSVRRRLLGDDHPDTLSSMNNLASILWQFGELDAAIDLMTKLLPFATRLGQDQAAFLGNLGAFYREARNPDEARILFLRALEVIEAQTQKADVSADVRSTFRNQYSAYYRAAFANSIALRRHDEAFAITERYRTQSLTLIAEQNLFEMSEIPTELIAQRDEVTTRYEAVFHQLDRLRSAPRSDDEAIRQLTQELDQLRRQRDVIEAKIRQVLAGDEWQPSKPLPLEEIRQALDPGTLLISYVFTEKGLDLFLVSLQEGLKIWHADVEHLGLRRQVENFRILMKENRASDARDNSARWLYDKLIQPIADRVAASDRLIILPDGPLHSLPFAALRRPDEDGGQYLLEWKPIHLAASASVYAKLRQLGPPRSSGVEDGWQLVAFGNPLYPGSEPEKCGVTRNAGELSKSTPLVVRSAVERGIFDGLRSLPCSLRELNEIREFFPEEAVRIHLGTNAREERAKAEATKARILHFATHGVVDPEAPLDSFLALTIPSLDESADDNGILQAWEILQRPLDADLVVLSACETAIGKNRGGEGLKSLSQIFQTAGARTVVASLWNVNDASTSELMIRFYRHLRAGKAKNEALQAAQLELIRGPIETVDADGHPITRDFSAPYHWAAFQVIGDWQ